MSLTRLCVALLLGAAIMSDRADAQIHAPELEPNLGWLNTDRPLSFKEDLKGHVVLLDFWTYCCINCMHVLPDLEYLEHKYADEPFVVIGVHSAKFTNESDRESIRQAMHRYDIKHPVVIDNRHAIWSAYTIRSWPSFVVIGADGIVVGKTAGEGRRDLLDKVIGDELAQARNAGTIAEKRVDLSPDAEIGPQSGLRFPGKVLADLASGRLFIADSSNDRIIVCDYPDATGVTEIQLVAGAAGERGFVDGSVDVARFHDPQGMAFDSDAKLLYVADTKNHAIRAIDLEAGTVSTIAGTGDQVYDREGGAVGTAQGLNSPWALAISRDRTLLYIAMAGPHQIWTMNLDSGVVQNLAGTGGENIVDGPFAEALLAQPSGLALSSDATRLYFADSEVSAIRALNLIPRTVETVIGHGLFEYGDVDGDAVTARLQHPLGLVVLPTNEGERLLVADTYNHKIKLLDPAKRTSTEWSVFRKYADTDSLTLDEPGGLSLAFNADGTVAHLFIADTNHHRIVMLDHDGGGWREVVVSEPEALDVQIPDSFVKVSGAHADAPLVLNLTPTLPTGAHLNPEAPATVRVIRLPGPGERVPPQVIRQHTSRTAELPIRVTTPADQLSENLRLLIELSYAYCFDDRGVCIPAEAAWAIELSANEENAGSLNPSNQIAQ